MPSPSILSNSLLDSFGNKLLVFAVSLLQFAKFVLLVFVSFLPFSSIKRIGLHVFTPFFILALSTPCRVYKSRTEL